MTLPEFWALKKVRFDINKVSATFVSPTVKGWKVGVGLKFSDFIIAFIRLAEHYFTHRHKEENWNANFQLGKLRPFLKTSWCLHLC